MPITGTLDVSSRLAQAPRMNDLDAEPWTLEGVDLLQLRFEIDDRNMAELLPKALHPTIPPTVIITVMRIAESPIGPFLLAQVLIGCRAGVRPRGYLLNAYCDSRQACAALAQGWGFSCKRGEIHLRRYHDCIRASVSDGQEILDVSLLNPEPISGADVQYVANMNLARLGSEDDKGVLVQVDPDYLFHRAERGQPELTTFDGEAWSAEGVDPVYPIVASFAQVDTGFPKIRYLLDPDLPAVQGTRTLA